MRFPTICLALLLTVLPAPTAAIHESEAGIIDWHKPLVGVPLIDSPNTAPLFHRVSVGQGVTKSVVVTATGSNVLAAIDPVDGSVGAFLFFERNWSRKVLIDVFFVGVVWRHVFDAEDPIALFRKHKDGTSLHPHSSTT